MNTPLVSVSTVTYNHAPFIRQCLDGILMQKTTFPIEMLIHDDASTDGTADIIREYEARYPDLIKAIYQTENQYSKGFPIERQLLFAPSRGKYIALCEGDDYWTDPLKLQKQVDFLEANPDYTICGGRYWVLEEGKPGLTERDWMIKGLEKYPQGRTITLNEIFDEYLLWILTVCFRKDSIGSIYKIKSFKDDFLFAATLENGKGFILPDYLGVYRLHPGGVWARLSVRERLEQNEVYMTELQSYFGKKSKSLRKCYFRTICGLRFIELGESKHLFRDFMKIVRFTFSGGCDTFFYRKIYFLKMAWKYLMAYFKKSKNTKK